MATAFEPLLSGLRVLHAKRRYLNCLYLTLEQLQRVPIKGMRIRLPFGEYIRSQTDISKMIAVVNDTGYRAALLALYESEALFAKKRTVGAVASLGWR